MKRRSVIAVGLLLAGSLVPVLLAGQAEPGSSNRTAEAVDSLDGERQHILDLISRYSHAWDSKDAEASIALFLEDATVSIYSAGNLTRTIRSSTELLAWAREVHRSHTDNGLQTRHYQTNTILERAPDGSVRGKTMFSVIWQYSSDEAPTLAHSGIYRDVFSKTSTGWRFARRDVYVDHK